MSHVLDVNEENKIHNCAECLMNTFLGTYKSREYQRRCLYGIAKLLTIIFYLLGLIIHLTVALISDEHLANAGVSLKIKNVVMKKPNAH